jgi:hypothetical protein
MPAGDHLPNHGITAWPKWENKKNPRIATQNFEDGQKKFGGCQNISGDAKIFPRNTKMFSGMTYENSGSQKKIPGAKKKFGEPKKKMGSEKNIFGHFIIFRGPNKEYMEG